MTLNRIIRWYNRNRKTFWIVIVISIIVISIPRILNQYAKNNKSEKSSSINNNTTTYDEIKTPAISGKEVNENVSKKTVNIINNFFEYCNDGNIEKAYDLLSENCKIELYPTVNSFRNNYYNKIFGTHRLYSIETWVSNEYGVTYRVTITEDILATGGINELNFEDYYTIIKENEEYKLNISNYIGKQEINVNNRIQDLEISVIEKSIYINYEIYKIKITNNSGKKIMIDSKQKTRTVNIIDQNDAKYVAFLNELTANELTISSGMYKEVKIKFNKSYNPKYVDKYIEFTDITDEDNNKIEAKIKI